MQCIDLLDLPVLHVLLNVGSICKGVVVPQKCSCSVFFIYHYWILILVDLSALDPVDLLIKKKEKTKNNSHHCIRCREDSQFTQMKLLYVYPLAVIRSSSTSTSTSMLIGWLIRESIIRIIPSHG